jgi:hypothetical protein
MPARNVGLVMDPVRNKTPKTGTTLGSGRSPFNEVPFERVVHHSLAKGEDGN